MDTFLTYIGFFLPAIVTLAYFLSRRRTLFIYIFPTIFLALCLITKFSFNNFESEEGNYLIYICITILLLFTYDFFYKKKMRLNLFAGSALLLHFVLNAIFIVMGLNI